MNDDNFWLDSPKELITEINVFPSKNQSLEGRMNTLTRFIILVALLMGLFQVKGSLYVLIFGILIIIILYYSQRDSKKSNKEFFTPMTEMTEDAYNSSNFVQVNDEEREQINQVSNIRNNAGTRMNVAYSTSMADESNKYAIGSVPTINYPNVGSIWYSAKHGPPKLREPPVVPINPADSAAWGGYNSIINAPQPRVLQGDYEGTMYGSRYPSSFSQKINWEQKENFSLSLKDPQRSLPPQQRHQQPSDPRHKLNDHGYQMRAERPFPTEHLDNYLAPSATPMFPQGQDVLLPNGFPEYVPPRQPSGQSMMLGGNRAQPPPRNTQLQSNIAVTGRDIRFEGNEAFIHNRSVNDPTKHHDFVQPINNINGISYMPSARLQQGDYDYSNITPWDPKYVRDHVSYTSLLSQPNREYESSDLGPYRVRPSLAIQEHLYNPQYESYGDDYRSYEDVRRGQVQYYYTNTDPYSGPMFITRSNIDHLDILDADGRVVPEYERNGLMVDDYMDIVADRQMADELMHRESMVAEARARMNEREFQLRMAPIRTYPGSKKY